MHSSIDSPLLDRRREERAAQSVPPSTWIVLGLLAIGTLAVYVPGWIAPPETLVSSEGTVYVADLDFWRRTDRETLVVANTRLDLNANLDEVPLALGDWTGVERPDTNQEVEILLNPEQYVRRLYQNSDGHYMWLTLIGGRSSQPFHAPDICYDADGWLTSIGSAPVVLDDGSEIHGLWLDASKQREDRLSEHFVYYFYLFPNSQRSLDDGIVLFKLTSNKLATVEETLDLHADFVRSLFSGSPQATLAAAS